MSVKTTLFVETVLDENAEAFWLEQTPKQLGSLEAAVANRRRLVALERGDWHLIGVRLAADITLSRPGRVDETLMLRTPGVWDVESDSGEDCFRELAEDEWTYLAEDLAELGLQVELPEFAELEIREASLTSRAW